MASVPISAFEHRVAQWAKRICDTHEPLEVSQRGRTRLVVLDNETFEQWSRDRERLQALEIKVLVDEGEKAFAKGRWLSHQAVGRRLMKSSRRRGRS